MIHRTAIAGGPCGPRRAVRPLLVRFAAALAAAALCLGALPAVAGAHGTPIPLDSWGPFGRANARCQRFIASSAAVCAMRAWRLRRACLERAFAGTPCDAATTDAAIESFRIDAANTVEGACTGQQVMNLIFLGVFEAANDAVTFCRELDTAATSAVMLPLPDNAAAPSEEVRGCVAAAADATSTLLSRAFRSRQRLLDRVAQKGFSPRRKNAMLAASTASIAGDAARLQAVLERACPADAFARTYGRDPATFLTLIASRGDCLAGQTYAQGSLLCPKAQCGNGMRESGERCDDGNVADGDGCSAGCTLE